MAFDEQLPRLPHSKEGVASMSQTFQLQEHPRSGCKEMSEQRAYVDHNTSVDAEGLTVGEMADSASTCGLDGFQHERAAHDTHARGVLMFQHNGVVDDVNDDLQRIQIALYAEQVVDVALVAVECCGIV